ncbi:MAG TPA: hypothetical protein VL371_01875 [Gemmataceae bacterium]|nr:hypothetical protein [Gemmataceae bacterium]
MSLRRSVGALGICAGLGGSAVVAADASPDLMPMFTTVQLPGVQARQVPPPPPPLRLVPPTAAPTPTPVPTPMPDVTAAPVTDVFARAPQAGTTAASNFQPHMLGDLLAGSYATAVVPVLVPVTITIPGTPGSPGQPGRPNVGIPPVPPIPPTPPQTFVVNQLTLQPIVSQPIITRGAFKISDNESPRPLDRIFATYNFFDNASLPTGPLRRTFDLHRETFGFEKTFLGGDASVGMRLNVMQADGSYSDDDFGDTTIVTKYALVNNAETGNVVSGGLAVTAPTGPRTIFPNGQTFRTTLLQPWTGFIYNVNDKWYAHGFSALVIPTDDEDVTLATSDIGIGWRAYQAACCSDYFISSVTPTLEGHYTGALNHRGLDPLRTLSFPEGVFVLTSGLHFGLGCNALLTTGLAVPLTGPRPFDLEAIAQLNWRF